MNAERSGAWFGLRFALREIRNHPRFSLFFTINLGLGLAGFIALDAFESSVASELESRSRVLLGADVEVSSRVPLSAEARKRLDAAAGPGHRRAEAVELFSMAAGSGRARLVEIRAVDPAFPLYGELVFADHEPARSADMARLRDGAGTWIDPLLQGQLGVALADPIRIGHATFTAQHAIVRDAGRTSGAFAAAPRLYIALERLAATGLVATGSRVRYRTLYRLPADADAEQFAADMRMALGDADIRVRTHGDTARELARGFGAVNDYLGLVSLIAVFLAGLGTAHLFREFLARRLRDVAILLSLGATRARAQGIFAAQLWLLALAAAVLATGLAASAVPLVARAAEALVSEAVVPHVGWRSLGLAMALALIGSTAACLPLLARIRGLRPARLFVEHADPAPERSRDLLLLIPAVAVFWLAAVWRVDDLRVGSLFALLFAAALVVFSVAGAAGLRALRMIPANRFAGALGAKLALRHLSRAHASVLGGFVSIALCAFLVSLAPQLQASLESDLDPPDGGRLPSLFLFDIQPEQVADLTRLVQASGLELQRTSPLVRARLQAINGAPSADRPGGGTGGGEGRRLRTRAYNLTYRDASSDSDRLVAGREFSSGPADPEEPAELSLEVDFAERLGVGLGDVLTFDVQGVPVAGRVTSLREVRWSSFQPNFFVAFQRGVLEEAPQIYLASVPALADTPRESLQAAIVDAFPNVSVIDVTAGVRRVLGLMDRLQWALQSTASAALLVGMVLIYAIARDQARARRGETNLLKVLGAEFQTIRAAVDIEFAVLGWLAALSGVGLSCAASGVLAHFALGADWEPAWRPLAALALAAPAICVLTARMATRAILLERPLALLQSGET